MNIRNIFSYSDIRKGIGGTKVPFLDIMVEVITRYIMNNVLGTINLHYEEEIFQYALEGIVSYLLGLILQIIFCIVTGFWLPTLIFIVGFESLRMRVGGYHATTYMKCNVAYLSLYLIYYGLMHLGFQYVEVFLLVLFVSIVIVYKYSPIKHENKSNTEDELLRNKQYTFLLLALFSCLCATFFIIRSEISLCIGYCIIFNAFAMVLGMFVNMRKMKTHVSSNEGTL